MQYVRSISGSVSKTWNSINPATLSGAIDVIVVENEDGTLACSPFHVRFGKFSLLRPYEKKVEFKVNNERQDYAMKLGEGGEAFFVFETTSPVPAGLQTSPVVSPVSSPVSHPQADSPVPDLEPLDLAGDARRLGAQSAATIPGAAAIASPVAATRPGSGPPSLSSSLDTTDSDRQWTTSEEKPSSRSEKSSAETPTPRLTHSNTFSEGLPTQGHTPMNLSATPSRAGSPPPLNKQEALSRAITLSKKLWSSNIPSQVNDAGDLMLDMTGYKSSEEESLRAEVIARKILTEELEGDYDIGSLIGADEKGNLWIYSSEEARDEAAKRAAFPIISPAAMRSSDALSDPGYQSDENQEGVAIPQNLHGRRESDSALGSMSAPDSPSPIASSSFEPMKNFAKTLRLTSDQLKSLNLKPGRNPMSFTVNRATCQAYMYLWKHDVPIVISDIDGTITKSDALGHVLNMIGRDWTHVGVAKLYTDIANNGYNIFYLTSRSVGQADTTRAYLAGIVQEGYKIPQGPVIMSPDRTIAALRREIYLRKPEVFKMACLRDILNLFGSRKTPFYAGFGNRLTDALSYRSVNIPSTRIFTINANAEVSLDLLSLSKYKTGYVTMRETVDHFFPPVGMLVHEGGESFTDFNYWRDNPLDAGDITPSDSEDEGPRRRPGNISDDEDESEAADDEILSEDQNELGESILSRESLEDSFVRQSIDSRMTGEMVRNDVYEDDQEDGLDDDDVDDDPGNRDVEVDVVAETTARASSGMLRTSLQNLAQALNASTSE